MEEVKDIVNLVLYFGTAGMFFLAFSLILFIYLYQRKLIKKNQAFKEIEDMLQKQELKSAYAVLEAQDKDRKRIAAEIHDHLGSMLVTANMYLDVLKESVKVESDVLRLNQLDKIIQQATKESRKISHSLDSGMLKHFGLKAGLEELEQTLNDTGAIEAEFEINLSQEIGQHISIQLYRVVQEMVNNTLKHANAKKIRLEVNAIKDEYLSIIYEDDGKGFDLKPQDQKGLGIRSIKSRLQELNAQIEIESEINKGFTANIEVPLHGKD